MRLRGLTVRPGLARGYSSRLSRLPSGRGVIAFLSLFSPKRLRITRPPLFAEGVFNQP